MDAKRSTTTHIFVPDTQIKPGVPRVHVEWIGQYIADEYAKAKLVVVVAGDWWDMPSLSSYDRKGGTKMEGRRYINDVQAGNDAWDAFNQPWKHVKCDRRFLFGNHEHRITRAVEQDAQIEGLASLDDLAVSEWDGWQRHDFLEPVSIDGVMYAHYFYNPMTGRPYAGQNLETRLKTVGHSFTMGHQQGLKWGRVDTVKGPHIGCVAGSCYVHDEDYLGPQAMKYWRGIVVKHQVENGAYDPMFVSLDYLARRYEGKRLSAIRWRK